MARLIDTNAFEEYHCNGCPYRRAGSCTKDDPICATIQDLKDFPTVDAVEVVHGHWKYGTSAAVCSECGFERSLDDNFGTAIACPNCGAKMDGDGNGNV